MPPASPPPPTSTGPRLWVRILLFVSLALNLLIVGAVAGVVLGARNESGNRVPPAALIRDLGLGPYMTALSKADRSALRSAAHPHQPRLRGGRTEMRVAFEETIQVLRAEELDQSRLLELIQRQAEVADQGRRLGQELLVTRISGMALEERRALADRLEKRVKRRKPPKHRD